jgi:hypothetical protein
MASANERTSSLLRLSPESGLFQDAFSPSMFWTSELSIARDEKPRTSDNIFFRMFNRKHQITDVGAHSPTGTTSLSL